MPDLTIKISDDAASKLQDGNALMPANLKTTLPALPQGFDVANTSSLDKDNESGNRPGHSGFPWSGASFGSGLSSRQGFRDVCTAAPPDIIVEHHSRKRSGRDHTPE